MLVEDEDNTEVDGNIQGATMRALAQPGYTYQPPAEPTIESRSPETVTDQGLAMGPATVPSCECDCLRTKTLPSKGVEAHISRVKPIGLVRPSRGQL
jgi:hypothetical protein